MTFAAGAVNNDGSGLRGLKRGRQATIIVRKIIAGKIQRSGHVSALEKDRGSRIEDECALVFHRGPEIGETYGCRRCDRERRRRHQRRQLLIESLFRGLINDRQRMRGEVVYGESRGRRYHHQNHHHPEVTQSLPHAMERPSRRRLMPVGYRSVRSHLFGSIPGLAAVEVSSFADLPVP